MTCRACNEYPEWGYTDSCQYRVGRKLYLLPKDADICIAYLHPRSFTHYTLPSLCNWMQWDFFSSERHWRKFDMHSFKVRHCFLSASLGLRVWYPWAGLSDCCCFCSCSLFIFSHSPIEAFVNFYLYVFIWVPFAVWLFGLRGLFQSGKLRWSRTFTGCFLAVIRDLFYEPDLTQWSFFMPMRRRRWTIRMFDSTLLYTLYEYFMYFGPACGFWSETQRKSSAKKIQKEIEHLLNPAIPRCLFKVLLPCVLQDVHICSLKCCTVGTVHEYKKW